ASTPVAAAMIAKGLNPGAALVFMLTGPATNASTVGIVARLFGRRFVLTYLGAIFGVALAAGTLVNLAFGPAWTASMPAAPAGASVWSGLQTVAGLALAVLMGKSLRRTGLRPGLEEVAGHFKSLASGATRFDWRRLRWKVVLRVATPLLLLLWISQGFVVVGPGEEGLSRTFGRAAATRLAPGLHVHWPPPIGRVDVIAMDAVRTVELGYLGLPERGPAVSVAPRSFPRVLPSFGGQRTSRIPEGSDFLAGDETVVAVTGVVQYQVADSALYRLGVDHPESVVRAVARSALVAAIARTPIDALYSSARGEVEARVLQHLRGSPTVAAIGVRPMSFNLLYVHAPDDVHAAFRDVASAAEDKTTIRNKALVEAEGSVRLARGEAARLVAEADAYRVQQGERARGNAAAFVPLAVEDRRASTVTRDRLYLEAMERVLGRLPKLIKPSPRRAPGLELWVTPGDVGGVRAPAVGIPPGSEVEIPDDDEGPPRARPTPPPRP
ncbi:MAG TPA: SPFH domain-containing protein, partial [Gaiellaceae bacterium]